MNELHIAKQEEAIRAIESGENIFISGPGGVGKSWIIKQVTNNRTVLCAPTGIAALNIGGITCHKAFGLPLGVPTTADYYKPAPDVFKGNCVDRIILDEVSMVRADYLDLIDRKLRNARKNDKPFGGIQMVVVGDFFQLEPIVKNSEAGYFYNDYDTPFAFGANCWDFRKIELTEIVRQSNEEHARILNSIRKKDEKWERAIRFVHKLVQPYDEQEDVLHLCCYKQDAETVNTQHFNKISGQVKTYKAYQTGRWGNEAPVEPTIHLKYGAKVLICANDPEGNYVNGDRGVVTGMGNESVKVLKDNGDEVFVSRFSWEKHKYTTTNNGLAKEPIAMFRQMPLRLGWAITIHKSQSLSLDDLALEIGRGCFGHGQLYVALSRITDLTKLRLVRPIGYSNVIVHEDVQEWCG